MFLLLMALLVPTTISKLVAQMGDDDFDIRQQASASLERYGIRAYKDLCEALYNDDLEIVSRAERLLPKIEEPLFKRECERVKNFSVSVINHANHDHVIRRYGTIIKSNSKKSFILTTDYGLFSSSKTFKISYNKTEYHASVVKRNGDLLILSFNKPNLPYAELSSKKNIKIRRWAGKGDRICFWKYGNRFRPFLTVGTRIGETCHIEHYYDDSGAGVFVFKDGVLQLEAIIWSENTYGVTQTYKLSMLKTFMMDIEWDK